MIGLSGKVARSYKIDGEYIRTIDIISMGAKNRNEKEKSLKVPGKVESLGNKAVLEKRINIRASDYRFEDKKKYYQGYTTLKGIEKEKTINNELIQMAEIKSDFCEVDIDTRKCEILTCFYKYLQTVGLIR